MKSELLKALVIFDNSGRTYYFNKFAEFRASVDLDETDYSVIISGLLSAIKIFAQEVFHEEVRYIHLENYFLIFQQRSFKTFDGKRQVYVCLIGEKSYQMKKAIDYTKVREMCHRIFWKFKESNLILTAQTPSASNPRFDDFLTRLVTSYNA